MWRPKGKLLADHYEASCRWGCPIAIPVLLIQWHPYPTETHFVNQVGKIGPDVARVMSPKTAPTSAVDGASRAASEPPRGHELEVWNPFYSSKIRREIALQIARPAVLHEQSPGSDMPPV